MISILMVILLAAKIIGIWNVTWSFAIGFEIALLVIKGLLILVSEKVKELKIKKLYEEAEDQHNEKEAIQVAVVGLLSLIYKDK